jgi:hypothetical protein
MTAFKQISYSDTGALDAFNRLRTSSPETIFQIQNQYDASPLEMESGNTGTGVLPSFSTSSRMVQLSGTAGTGVSYHQSYQYNPYQPGKSQFIAITGLLGTGVAGWTQDFGYFDSLNGVIYRQNGVTNLQVGIRTSTSGGVVETWINQADWNIDGMDINLNSTRNPSGLTLDPTKTFILIIDLQFLGMGRVRVGFDIDGVVYYVHEFLNANVLTVPYMQSASLPIAAVLTGTTTAAPANCYFKCATVQSEGGALGTFGYQFSTPSASVTAASTRTHLMTIRPKTLFNTMPNRSMFSFDMLNITVTGTASVYWELCIGVNLTGATVWNSINSTHSAFEYNTNGTYNVASAPVVVACGYVASTNTAKMSMDRTISLHYPITLNRAGANRDLGQLTLLVTSLGVNSVTHAALEHYEIR